MFALARGPVLYHDLSPDLGEVVVFHVYSRPR